MDLVEMTSQRLQGTTRDEGADVTEANPIISEATSIISRVVATLVAAKTQQIASRKQRDLQGQQEEEDVTIRVLANFIRQNPPNYQGGIDPGEATYWIQSMEKIFSIIGTPADRKVGLATYMLTQCARQWWMETREAITAAGEAITWEVFRGKFAERHFLQTPRSTFLDLRQECLTPRGGTARHDLESKDDKDEAANSKKGWMSWLINETTMGLAQQFVKSQRDLPEQVEGEQPVIVTECITFHALPKFWGGFGSTRELARLWLREVEKGLKAIGCQEGEEVRYATFALQDNAKEWWEVTKQIMRADQEQITWETFKEKFSRRYFPRDAPAQLWNQGYICPSCRIEPQFVTPIIGPSPENPLQTGSGGPSRSNQRRGRGKQPGRKPYDDSRNRNTADQYQPVTQNSEGNQGQRWDVRCFNCGRKGHFANQCSNAKTDLCFNCERPGHQARDCTAPRAEPATNVARTRHAISRNEYPA